MRPRELRDHPCRAFARPTASGVSVPDGTADADNVVAHFFAATLPHSLRERFKRIDFLLCLQYLHA